MQASQELVVPIMQEQHRVYCQVVNRNITTLNCMQTQGQSECFACAAPSRMCEQCKKRLVAVSVMGMCDVCSTRALCEEEKKEKPIYHFGDKVYCQMVSKKINTSTCLNMQGTSECQDCPAPSRICEQCGNRPVAISRTGLCLHCIVQEYGQGWKSLTETELIDALQEPKNSLSPDEKIIIQIPQEVKETNVSSPGEHIKLMTDEDAKMVKNHTTPLKPARKQTRLNLELIHRAQELITKHEYASALFLKMHLGISYYRAQQLLDYLENQGIVGPSQYTKARDVYPDAKPHLNLSDTHTVYPETYIPHKRTFIQMINDVRTFILTTGETRIRFIRIYTHVSGKYIPAVMKALTDEGTLGTAKRGRGNTRPILVPLLTPASDLSDCSDLSDAPGPMNDKNLRSMRIKHLNDFAILMGEQSEFVHNILMPTIDDLSLLESIAQVLEKNTLELCGIFKKITATL